MTQYGEFLTELLHPLGIYDLAAGNANESELYALGNVLDTVAAELETIERESHIATAEGIGLERRETLFANRPAAPTTGQRRAAIMALLQVDSGSLTPNAINRTLAGCGIRALAEETDTGHLRVRFPEVGGVPENFERIQKNILDILPCHLETDFFFRYMTWAECETQGFTWTEVEAAGHTWESFEKSVLPEA